MSRWLFASCAAMMSLAAAVVGLSGCGGGGGGIAGGNTVLGVTASGAQSRSRAVAGTRHTAAPPLLVVALPDSETVELDAANVGVKDVDLETPEQAEEAEDEAADDDDIEFPGPYVADVVAEVLRNPDGTIAVDIRTDLPPGTVLEEAEVDVARLAGVCPDPASLVSIHIHGTYRDAGGTEVYSFHLDAGPELEVEYDDEEGGIVIDGQALLDFIFALDHWFDGVDLSAADTSVVDGSGDVLFDDANNTDLRDAIVDNLLAWMELCEDDDHDGHPEDTF